jgi:hypothetical protein
MGRDHHLVEGAVENVHVFQAAPADAIARPNSSAVKIPD